MKKTKSELPPCKFGEKCYRKNADHLRSYSHPTPAVRSPKASPKRRTPSPGNDHPVSPNDVKTASSAKKNKITDFFSSNRVTVTVDESPTRKRKIESNTIPQENLVQVEPKKAFVVSSALSQDVKEWIHTAFCLTVPDDFFVFWRYCCQKNPSNPCEALVPSLGLHLVGPYDVLSEKINRSSSYDNLYLHWRYFTDPPEVLTVLAELSAEEKSRMPSSSGFHIGYFRDEPDDAPVFVVWNYAGQNGNLLVKGDNLFASVRLYAEEIIRQKKCDETKLKMVRHVMDDMAIFLAENHLNFSMDVVSKSMKVREKKVVSRTFHGAGLMVPVVNDVGYRPLPENPAGLKKILAKIVASKTQSEKLKALEPLQEIVTLCQFANDEGDFGEAIELGLDLFTFGSDVLHSTISHLLPVSYRLAGREKFAEIIEQHIANRHSLSENIDYSTAIVSHDD